MVDYVPNSARLVFYIPHPVYCITCVHLPRATGTAVVRPSASQAVHAEAELVVRVI